MHLSTPFVLVTFAYLFAGVRCGDADTCNTIMDLVFLVDKSGSIKDWQFTIEKEFLFNVTDILDVGVHKTHVAMSLYATGFHLKWCFIEYTDKTVLQQKELEIECPECVDGQTNTGLALKGVREQVLVQACDVRPLDQKVPRVVIVLTDGKSTEKPPKYPANWLKEQAELLRLEGQASILAVGVGKHFETPTSIGYKDLEQIADNKDMIFATSSFDDLGSLREKIFAQVCEAAEKGCDAKVDIVFMMDISGSIFSYRKSKRSPKWNLMKKFAKKMINEFDIGDNAHVALQVFADVQENAFCFDSGDSKAAMKNIVKNLKCTTCKRGETYIGAALDNVREFVLTPACGVRDFSVPKIVIVLTDGKTTEDIPVFRKATDDLKALPNTTVMAVGFGKYNLKWLKTIATPEPGAQRPYKWVWTHIDNGNFLTKAKGVAKAACAEANDAPFLVCKAGWTFDVTTQQCYKWINQPVLKGFEEFVCDKHDAKPISIIKTIFTQNLVSNMSNGARVWLDMELVNGVWEEPNGKAVKWRPWKGGRPKTADDCAVTEGRAWRNWWYSYPCSSEATVVCSMPREV